MEGRDWIVLGLMFTGILISLIDFGATVFLGWIPAVGTAIDTVTEPMLELGQILIIGGMGYFGLRAD